jgi:hypothetical protein
MKEVRVVWKSPKAEGTSTFGLESLPRDPSELINRLKNDLQPSMIFLEVALLYFRRGDDLSYKRVLQAGSDSGTYHRVEKG